MTGCASDCTSRLFTAGIGNTSIDRQSQIRNGQDAAAPTISTRPPHAHRDRATLGLSSAFPIPVGAREIARQHPATDPSEPRRSPDERAVNLLAYVQGSGECAPTTLWAQKP